MIATLPDASAVYRYIADAIYQQGWCAMPAALPPALVEALSTRASALPDAALQPAGIGRGPGAQQDTRIRRDRIHWLEEDDAITVQWLAWLEGLRLLLNRELMLGLFSVECHIARYDVGDFYLTHRDAFRGESNRRVSIVLYLNADWPADGGGELVLYNDAGDALARITPELGTLVAFLSEEFPHEVLPARQTRFSIAGWFRINTSIDGIIDPPQ